MTTFIGMVISWMTENQEIVFDEYQIKKNSLFCIDNQLDNLSRHVFEPFYLKAASQLYFLYITFEQCLDRSSPS